ncbi:MAG TPA: efflux RND transporter periplasmic adaptor subunit [Ignavibacteriaceae bacterium]|nr:efflux RND transporter periplasmic adaptor subunit [Ignavibacteriaceae bacterium]
MKKLKIGLILFAVIAGIIFILLNNKSKLEAKSKTNVIDTYSVSVETVMKKEISKNLELIGTITGNNDVAVVAEASGRVTGVFTKVGDNKSKGGTLFQLDDELKHAAYLTAEANYEKAKNDFTRYEFLFKEGTIAETRFEAAKFELQSAESQYIFARREYSDSKITAPISGIVTAKNVDEGDFVNKGTIVANIVDISRLKVKLNVAEKDAFRLKAGDKVEIFTDVYPGVTFNGMIESISAQGDQSHTYPVEISFPNNSKHPLKAGMFGRVSFTSIKKDESLIIPRAALMGSTKDAKVFTVENGISKQKKIVVGNVYDDMIEVLQGLNEGEKVVVNGQNNLKNDYRVNVVE